MITGRKNTRWSLEHISVGKIKQTYRK